MQSDGRNLVESHSRKRFYFPKQVNKDFFIYRDITLKQALMMLPSIGLGYVIWKIIPSFNSVSTDAFIKGFCSFLPATLFGVAIFRKPIRERPNITLMMIMKNHLKYNSRQRLFFFKKRGGHNF